MNDQENIQEHYIEKRNNGSQVYTEPYSKESVNRLKSMIFTFFNQGEKKYYSISVDGENVVPKNYDGRNFSKYMQFVNKHTKVVEVRMYQGESPNCNIYRFIINKEITQLGKTPVIDVQKQIDKALEDQKLKQELSLLRKELEKKKKKIKKLKEEGTNGVDFDKIFSRGIEVIGAIKGNGASSNLSGTPNVPESEVEIEIEEKSTSPEYDKSHKVIQELLKIVDEKSLFNAVGWVAVLVTNKELQEKIENEINKIKNKENGEAHI